MRLAEFIVKYTKVTTEDVVVLINHTMEDLRNRALAELETSNESQAPSNELKGADK